MLYIEQMQRTIGLVGQIIEDIGQFGLVLLALLAVYLIRKANRKASRHL